MPVHVGRKPDANTSWKASARVKAVGNVVLAAPGAVIDGVIMVLGDRFLAASQTAPDENGIYIWNGPAVPATRAPDADTAAELVNATIAINDGTSAGTIWLQTTPPPIVVGATALVFAQVGSGSGDVIGPALSTDNAVVRFDGVTGELIQNSVATLSDTGEFRASVGSAANPSYGFTGTTDGIFRPAASQVGISIGGAITWLFGAGTSGYEFIGQNAAARILAGVGTVAAPSYSWVGGAGQSDKGFFSANVDEIDVSVAGVLRWSFGLASGDGAMLWGRSTLSGIAAFNVNTGMLVRGLITTGNTPAVSLDNNGISFTGGAGALQVGVDLPHTVNQSSTAAFTALRISTTQTAVGSGNQLALAVVTGGSNVAEIAANGVASVTGLSLRSQSPGAMAAVENDFSGTGQSSFGRLTGNAAGTVITGFLARDQRFLILVNIAAPTITVNHLDAGSGASNQVITSTGLPVVLGLNDTITMIYDSTTAKWRQLTLLA